MGLSFLGLGELGERRGKTEEEKGEEEVRHCEKLSFYSFSMIVLKQKQIAEDILQSDK